MLARLLQCPLEMHGVGLYVGRKRLLTIKVAKKQQQQ